MHTRHAISGFDRIIDRIQYDVHAHQRIAYVGISATFFGLLVFASIYGGEIVKEITPLKFVMLAFCAIRLGRLMAYDTVFSTYRSFWVKTVPDSTGAGESTEPAHEHGHHRALGELLSCPICSGTWATAAVVYLALFLPAIAWNLIAIMGAIGAGEVLNSIIEACGWFAQAQREQVGRHVRRRTAECERTNEPDWMEVEQ